jgi:Na+-translocating ferredoxin:NAD+ oxidoreductase subunit B
MDFLVPVLILGILGLIAATVLVTTGRKAGLRPNAAAEQIMSVLPDTDCGTCGYSSCVLFAQAVADNHADPAACLSGGAKVVQDVTGILEQVIPHPIDKKVAVVHCKGGAKEARTRAIYDGIGDCHAAIVIGDSGRVCSYGCIGLGTCVRACPENAITINSNGLAVIDTELCTGCEACLAVCPRSIISMIPAVHKIYLACANRDHGSRVKNYCCVGCTACAICVKVTPTGAVSMESNLPVLDYFTRETFVAAANKCPQNCFIDMARARPKANIDSKCDGCGVCPESCPVDAITGTHGERHTIDKALCIGCGICVEKCHAHAISLWGGMASSLRQEKLRRTRRS